MQLLYKLIYNSGINYFLRNLNKITSSFLPKKIKIPPSGILKLKTDSGLLKIATNQTSYVTQLLFWNGYKNFEYSEIFEHLSKHVRVFLDIGSNIGYFSLLAAKSNPNITVFAFEPAHGPKYFLNKNIKLNTFSDSIKAIDLAISDTSGTIDFYEVKSTKYNYITYNLAGEGNAGTKKTSRNFIKNTVKSETLENFIRSNNITHIDLIKIDTEGTEVTILESGKSSIEKFQPIVICETLFDTIERDLEHYFKSLNYEFYNHTKSGLVKTSTLTRSEDNGIRNCFFVPKSKLHLISKFINN